MDAIIQANSRADVVVDHSTFDALDDDPDTFDFRKELAVEFLNERKQREPVHRAFFDNNDYVNLHESAHKDKSGALTLGFNRIANIYLRIELRSKFIHEKGLPVSRAEFESDFAALTREYDALKTYLEAFFKEPLE